jgi:hypothetical protein
MIEGGGIGLVFLLLLTLVGIAIRILKSKP